MIDPTINIYLDAGFYCGNALQKLLDAGTIDKTWKIIAFEPSNNIDIEDKVAKFDLDIELIKKAVWVDDKGVTFWESGRENAGFIAGTSYSGAPIKKRKVPSIDFSYFVSQLPRAYIYCSMDIEGSEYNVLEKMIKDGTINRINVLEVEFHHRFMKDYDKEDSLAIISELKKRNINVILKEYLS
jgi:FkbM family methyltransferase